MNYRPLEALQRRSRGELSTFNLVLKRISKIIVGSVFFPGKISLGRVEVPSPKNSFHGPIRNFSVKVSVKVIRKK